MAAVGKDRDARAVRERARVYQARKTFHQAQERRRVRDNLIAGIAGGMLIVAVLGGQLLYFTVGPGAPVPAPSPSATTTPAPVSPSPTTTLTPTPAPSPTTTP